MQRWEYMTLDLLERKLTIEDLNRLGREGWEAVATGRILGRRAEFPAPRRAVQATATERR